MPLPDHPVEVEGGCNCGAIRYRVRIPTHNERPIYPLAGAESNPPTRMPFVCTDHCNDCRRATGALLPFWLLCPTDMIVVSLLDQSVDLREGRVDPLLTAACDWQPAEDVFLSDSPPVSKTYLSFFNSSPARRRSFCSRCGTQMFYQAFPTPDFLHFPMLDICLGTIDRQFLQEDMLKPERQLHWRLGIDWVHKLSKDGLKVPIHPTSWVGTQVES